MACFDAQDYGNGYHELMNYEPESCADEDMSEWCRKGGGAMTGTQMPTHIDFSDCCGFFNNLQETGLYCNECGVEITTAISGILNNILQAKIYIESTIEHGELGYSEIQGLNEALKCLKRTDNQISVTLHQFQSSNLWQGIYKREE